MPTSEIHTALLDVDGTLVDSNRGHAQAWSDALAEFDFDVPSGFLVRLIGMGGDKILPLVSPRLTATNRLGKRIAARRSEIFVGRYLPEVEPTPGARDLLERLRAAGIQCVVASSASSGELDLLLERAAVRDLIQATAGNDDAQHSKPDPDIIRAALERSATASANAILIGDTPYDILAAANAKVPTIALRCGGWEDGALANAIAIFDDPAGLLLHFAESPFQQRRS
jgi:HAD superfamily hydrolase (TIGR01509 family)